MAENANEDAAARETAPGESATSAGGPGRRPADGGNLLTRILVPVYLVVLIIIFTDVLLITWPITHADESVVCFEEAEPDGALFDPFAAIDTIIHDLIQYCPDTDPGEKIVEDGAASPAPARPGAGGQPVPGAIADAANADDIAAMTAPDPDGKPGLAAGDEAPIPSKFTDPRQANALFLAVLATGMIGGAVYSLRAHTVHIAVGNYQASWWQWNVTRPFLSGALAILFFFLVRAGFVENGQASSLRPEGFIAIAGLVGLFTDQAWSKIRQVADAMFARAEHETERVPASSQQADPASDEAASRG